MTSRSTARRLAESVPSGRYGHTARPLRPERANRENAPSGLSAALIKRVRVLSSDVLMAMAMVVDRATANANVSSVVLMIGLQTRQATGISSDERLVAGIDRELSKLARRLEVFDAFVWRLTATAL